MNGFRDAIIKSGTGHIQVARSAAYFDAGDTNPIPFMLDDEKAIDAQLRSIPGVADVMPTMAFSARLFRGRQDELRPRHRLPDDAGTEGPEPAHDRRGT